MSWLSASIFSARGAVPIGSRHAGRLARATVALALGCAACGATGGAYSLDIPAHYRASDSASSERDTAREPASPDTEWWQTFRSPELDRLVARGMRANQDLEAGVARVAQARAAVGIDRSALLPQLGLSGSGSGERTQRTPTWRDSASSGLGVSYELDLFGANRNTMAGSEAALESDVFNQRALALAVQGDIAEAYFSDLVLQERIEVARENLRASEQVFELVTRRHAEGATSGLDHARQTSALASARARIPALELQIAQNQHALAVLVGESPQRFELSARTALGDVVVPSVGTGVPSQLLTRRPDLASSEAALRAANADIAVARAAFLPRIDLGGALTGAALTGASDLVTSLSAGLAAPIFNGGRLRAELTRTRERREELLASYRGDILTALREVEDALVAIRVADERGASLQIAASEAQRAFDLARVRYREGAADLLSVLDAQQQLLDASDGRVQAKLDRIIASVRLFRALGGGWEQRT